MKIALIKQLNEKIPYWAKRPFAPVIRRKLITNPTFVKQYEALLEGDAMSEEDMRAEQFRLLQQTLRHAYDHTAYYRGIFDGLSMRPEDIRSIADLEKLPVLTKKDLAVHFAELQADDVPDSYEVSTGGTTGKPTRVMMARDAIYREWAFIYHYWSKYGYDYRSSRLATLRGVNLGRRLYEINPLYQEIRLNLFLMNRDNIRQYVRAAGSYGADFIYGYPSAVYNFSRLAREAGIALHGKFKAALLISENLYPFQEEEIAGTLGCPIAIFYGHSERAVFGERYTDGYMFQPLYGVTEISAENTPIVTGFVNRKTPLIRYEVDDHVEPLPGEGLRITGHWNADILEGKNGEQISAAAINFHDKTFEGVEKYQFIQEKAGSCVLNIVPCAIPLSESKIADIEKSVRTKFGGALSCRVCVVSELEMTSRGKYQMVIRRYNGGGKLSTEIPHPGTP